MDARAQHPQTWHCEAYGPDLQAAMNAPEPPCFFELISRCTSPQHCSVRLTRERRRVYNQLLALAAEGDGTAWFILENLDGPDDLLGGSIE